MYLSHLFKNRGKFQNNYRNNFTKEYYESLKNNEVNLIEEIKKYRTKSYKDAEFILCHLNSTRNKYNDLMMKHLKIKFGEINCKVMCKTNKLYKHGIYNNFILTVTDRDEHHVTLDGSIKIPVSLFNGIHNGGKPNFIPGYSRTIYNVQGSSTGSFYVPDEDLSYFNNPKSAYTLISRIKEEIKFDKIPKQEKQKVKEETIKLTFEL